ncbi:MAG: hypothetical protein JNG86_16115 [Verrucomicrobiaceae bacterium]|nr:hypothetical protein [Verrucomicrobiaceae bacterium]
MSESPDSPPAETSAPAPRRRPGCLTLTCASLFILMTVGGVVVWKMIDMGFDFARYGLTWLASLPERLQNHKITDTFRQEVTRITSTEGDVLEIATMETVETVTKSDTKTLFDDIIYLGTTESEIRVPAVYRFHIKLSDPWRLEVHDGRCIVIAPPVRPTLPPAIRTDGMEKKTEAGWLRFNATDNLTQLEKNLTPTLEKRAGGHILIPGVRDSSRQSVAQFVRKWILKEHPGGAAIKDIVVIFPDEPGVKNPIEAAGKLKSVPVIEKAEN